MANGLALLKQLARQAGVDDAEAEAIYQEIVDDYTSHFDKHIAAEKLDHPEKALEIAVLEAVAVRIRADRSLPLTTALNEALEPPREQPQR